MTGRRRALTAFRLVVAPSQEEDVSTFLADAGTAGVHVESEGPGGAVLLAYFDARPGLREDLARGASILGVALREAEVPDVDWVQRFREGFRPVRAGGFVIVPSWEAPSSPDPRTLVVDPGRAFGTGTHETTRLCLRALEGLAERGALGRVLDLGAGTGLLAVAASRLGAALVVAVDNDPDAVEAVGLHARLNHVDVGAVLGDGGRPFAPGSFDLVLANLTAPLLLGRRDELLALRSAKGALVLSGFLEEDLPELEAAFALPLPRARTLDGEWASLQLGPP